LALRQDLKNCERYFIGLKTINGDAVRYKAFPARCSTWECPICARIKSHKYQLRMRPLFEKKQLFFYTLTFYHSQRPDAVWSNVSRVWNRFRTAAVKQFGSINYVRVLEHHKKSPYPHLHIIADTLLPATWLGAEAVRAGFGYQIDSKPITSKGAAIYVSKYLSKPWSDPYCSAIRKGLRLRVISFGGTVCHAQNFGSSWDIITRAICGSDVIDCINTDHEWELSPDSKMTYEMSTDDYYEVTYVTGTRGLNTEEVKVVLPHSE
jgi:hypothetical protein